jgi:hypothetical protein
MSSELASENCPQCGGPIQQAGQRVTCGYCGAALIRRQEQASEGSKWGVHLKAVNYVDQQCGGVEAFRLLIPKTWEFKGGVTWRIDNPGTPATIAFTVSNPEGQEAFEVFPNIPCYWTNQMMVTGFFPPGSRYFGNEVRPPAPALEVLRDLVVPRYREGVMPWEIVQQEHLPDLPAQLRANSPASTEGITSADGGRVRVRYHSGDHEIEEDFFGVVEIASVSMPMLMGVAEHVYWTADYLFSFRAVAGQLDRLADQFLSMVQSFRLNSVWFNRVTQASQFMIQNQIQHIRNVGQLSQIISQTNDQISDMIMSSYQSRQATMDRLSTQFSQAIRGVDEYYDPLQDQGVELPGGYDFAWSNSLGEYIVTDDPNFNPNVETNLNWEKLKRT